MIHQIQLPEITKKRLTDIVMLQLRLLKYAASRKTLTEIGCAKFLNKSRRFRGRGDEIAKWLWRGSVRLRLLRGFAGGATSAVKLQWVSELSIDVIKLLRHGRQQGHLHQQPNGARGWQKNGTEFLRKYYSDWYEKGFPMCFFSEAVAEPFTRHEFISAFKDANKMLYVCAACDDATAIAGRVDARKSSIDHYFPQESYPHLVLHPYNLIPGCHFCNSAKGSNDIVRHSGGYRDLREVLLPFREPGLSKSTYLQAKFRVAKLDVQFGPLKPLRHSDVQSRIDAFAEVFDIPARWGGSVDRIGETLFREMKQFRGANAKAVNAPEGLLEFLEDMLQTYRRENLGKASYVFAMNCWLEKILKHAVRPMVQGRPSRSAEKRFLSIQQQLRVKL